MPIPVPTVGRKVYYFASSNQTEPWDATVIKVLEDNGILSLVNLTVTDPDTGISAFRGNVAYGASGYAAERFDWMDYQKRDVTPPVVIEPSNAPRRAAVPFDADESNKIGQANALRDQAGFMLSEFLVAILLFACCTLAFAKGNPAALAKYRAEKAAATSKAPAAGKGYTVPSAGKWSKPAGAAAPVSGK